MLAWIRRLFTAPVFEDDEEKTYNARLLNSALLTILVIAVTYAGLSPVLHPNSSATLLPIGVMILAGIGALSLMHRGLIRPASMLISASLWVVVTLVTLFSGGLRTPSFSTYITVILIAGLLLGRRVGLIYAGLSAIAGLGILYAEENHLLPPPLITTTSLYMWGGLTGNFIAAALLLYLATRNTSETLERIQHNERSLIEANREMEARTQNLERLTAQLKAAAKMSRAAIFVHDLDTLLSQVTHMISEVFGFYHSGIFLLDENGEYAVLQAANSPGGQQMLANGHKLKVGQQGVVGYVTGTGKPRIALDVGTDAVHFENPLLPETRSEMALPLKVGERIIGALDVQSRQAAAYNEDDVMVLQIMADQLAVSIENARLLNATQKTVEELSSAAAEILAATTQQASGASEQSAAITQTTTTVDQVKVIAEQAISRAQEVVDLSQRSVQVSRSGQEAVRSTIEGMTQIKERVEGIAENILALSERTHQISEIIATVNDIAAQSNILALNASVEVARAGEHGKGFAVVAGEVRNLAEQSKQATAQVRTILSDIQNGINATVMVTEEGAKVVEQGVQLIVQTQEVIQQLATVIEESAQAAAQMVAGGRQQASGVEQVAIAMQNINQATTQSLASTRQTEKAAQELNKLAHNLTEIVEQYRLQDVDSRSQVYV